MKSNFYLLLFLLLSIGQNQILAQDLPTTGGGEYHFEPSECISLEQANDIKQILKANINQLISEGKLSVEKNSQMVNYRWPIQQAEGFEYNSVYGISNFVDQAASGALLDHTCSNRTYNGHRGTDIFLWPFPWKMVDEEQVEVVAAAPGTIVWKKDGEDSYSCTINNMPWNAIFVRHDDNSVTWYGHLKEGSLTDKGIGDTVSEGEFLGVVASSGNSTGPHLHFEVYDADNNLLDPYQGDCNNLNTESLWQDQRPYREPTVNAIFTHAAIPEFSDCSQASNPVSNHASNCFNPGETVYFACYFHDELEGMFSGARVIRPNGSIKWGWTYNSQNTYNGSWRWWSRDLPEDAQEGEWIFEIDFDGTTYSHAFQVGGASITSDNENFAVCPGESIQLSTSNDGIDFTWNTGSTDQSIEVITSGNYSVTVTTALGCVLESSQVVTESLQPIIINIDGPETSSPLISETYAVNSNNGSTYSWTVEGGTIISGAELATVEIEWQDFTMGEICVTETNEAGCTSNAFCMTVELQPTGIEDIEALNDVQVFPNPIFDQFHLMLDLKTSIENLNLKILSATGQLVQQQKFNHLSVGKWQQQINVSDISAGLYWLEIQLDDQSIAQKLIVY